MFDPLFKKTEGGWPPLPESGFVSGRAATVADVETGDAAFAQTTSDGVIAEPLKVAIPQYALWTDEDGATTRAILVQGERHAGDGDQAVLGLRTLDGEMLVALAHEVRLLGDKPPAA